MTLAPFVRRSVFGFPVDHLANGLDNTMEQFFARGTYPVDVREDVDHLYVDAELPGFKKEEIDITLENNELTITAEKQEEKKVEGVPETNWLLSERRVRSFRRSFELPQNVDGSNVNAALQDGVLTVTLNKRQESKPRRITVS